MNGYKKSFITLSAIAALSINSFAEQNVEQRLEAMETKIKKLEKQLKKAKKNISAVKKQANNDNIKFDVDFRTAMDNIEYKHADGSTSSNHDLLTNRLWLNMGYAPSENVIFKGTLSYYKAYGDSANHDQSNVVTSNQEFQNFDWVTNENATDNTVKVKEAYWLYLNDTLFGADVPWTVSAGRRPSTDGLGINVREGQSAKSPLSHTVNVEFDGFSAKYTLENVTNVEGMWFKLCTGRGLTNAEARFQSDGSSYAEDTTSNEDIDMYGFIFVPWDNGQYSVHTNWAKAVNLIGYSGADLADFSSSGDSFSSVGDMTLFTAMFKAEGIGDGINDFLDESNFFISFANSKTDPSASSDGMLGSTDGKSGHSTWLGFNFPCPLTEDGRVGIEWNKGSKYWRSVTYGEDTMTGSKIAARGTAWEVYYQKPLTKALFFDARYTKIKYDYTGSQAFFGADGTPYDIDSATAQAMSSVKESSDLRLAISYRY